MKIGIAAPSSGTARAYPRRLIVIQERSAEVEHRAQHEDGEERAGTERVLPLLVEEETEHRRRQREEDHERAERPERVHVVGEREPARP
jgi:hypothetical protein